VSSPDDRPVSWFLIEPGWKVVTADGAEVGEVAETVGDSTHDIFDGLTVRSGLWGKPRYVAAEAVTSIVEGTVRLKLSRDQVKYLRAYEEPPPSREVLPDGAPWTTRLLGWFRGRSR
jgi:hypothetical protein